MFSAWLEDDEGRRVRLSLLAHLTPGGRWGAWRRARPMARLVVRGATSRAGLLLTASIVVLGLIASGFVAVGPMMLPLLLFSPVLSTLVLLGMTSAVGVGDAVSAWTAGFKADCLKDGRCAACAYDLTDLEEGPSGLVVCPECGARWLPASKQRHAPPDVVVVRP